MRNDLILLAPWVCWSVCCCYSWPLCRNVSSQANGRPLIEFVMLFQFRSLRLWWHALLKQLMPLQNGSVTAVMIARGTYGNPWIFKNTQAFSWRSHSIPTLDQMNASFMMHVRLLDAAHIHIARARSLSTGYFWFQAQPIGVESQ